MRRSILTFVGSAVILVGVLAQTATASTVVATFAAADLGQGAWAGAALMSDGAMRGGGGISVSNGVFVGTIEVVSWTGTAVCGGTVTINAIFHITKPAQFDFASPLTVPVTGKPMTVTEEEGSFLFRVTPTGGNCS